MRPSSRLLSLAGLAAGVLLTATACSSAASTASSNVLGATSSAGLPDLSSPAASAMQSAMGLAATVNKLCVFLVGPDGKTLYVFAKDTPDQSNCTDQCATMWPPVTVPAGTKVTLPAQANFPVGTISRADGTTQVTYNHAPLYTYSGDTNPGDTNGNGLNGLWFVASIVGSIPTQAAGAGGALPSSGASESAGASMAPLASPSAGASY
jgi:predicted lipoprotein with Yx(FWY)xxD motif